MSNVTLTQASTIIDQALAKGRELNLHPLTVVVLDAGGHLVAMKREDKSGILRTEIATGKAWGTLGMGFGGREFARRAAGGGAVFLQALMAASGGRVVPAPGGVLIRDNAGDIIGAVGISGDTSDKDETCAVAGITAVGLNADTGESV
ncbi:MAG TPA: heme-binding protein [Stellaceae bacterium]|nr:heme-binding protein [Stellaceae bacterium]